MNRASVIYRTILNNLIYVFNITNVTISIYVASEGEEKEKGTDKIFENISKKENLYII